MAADNSVCRIRDNRPAPAYIAYRLLGTGIVASLFPSFLLYSRITGRYRHRLSERMGRYGTDVLARLKGAPRVWLHAVSVGEVMAAAPILDALAARYPDSAVVVSTVTEHGLMVARERFHTRAACILAPIDVVFATRNALRRIRPDVLVLMETELWPAWLVEARRRGIRTALVNGRISVRSFSGYMKIRALMRTALDCVDVFSMIGADDAERIRQMGGDGSRIRVNGNAKYDGLSNGVTDSVRDAMRRLFDFDGSEPVLVAGSTRGNEDALVLEAFRKIRRRCPDAVLVLAPRHLAKIPGITALIEDAGLTFQHRSDLGRPGSERTAPVILLDTIGELFAAYSVATVVFCGGSLVPTGGQNVMEPAAWGKPVLYGPSMEDFSDARDLLRAAGGGICVGTPDALTEVAGRLLVDRRAADALGRRAQKAVTANRGAGVRHAAEVARLLDTGIDR